MMDIDYENGYDNSYENGANEPYDAPAKNIPNYSRARRDRRALIDPDAIIKVANFLRDRLLPARHADLEPSSA